MNINKTRSWHHYYYIPIILSSSPNDDNCKHLIIGLLKRIGEAYKVDNRQNKFVEDLVALNVPDLLVGSADVEVAFIDMIHKFVQNYGLQQVIMEQVLGIVVRWWSVCINYNHTMAMGVSPAVWGLQVQGCMHSYSFNSVKRYAYLYCS